MKTPCGSCMCFEPEHYDSSQEHYDSSGLHDLMDGWNKCLGFGIHEPGYSQAILCHQQRNACTYLCVRTSGSGVVGDALCPMNVDI